MRYLAHHGLSFFGQIGALFMPALFALRRCVGADFTPQQDNSAGLDVCAALQNREITAWFQPQFSLSSGAVTGLEGLARWHHPTRGVLSPDLFLGAIKQAGQWSKFTDHMIESALYTLCHLQLRGIYIPHVAVNIDMDDLCDAFLVERVKWALDRHDLPADRLCIEIVETVVAKGCDDLPSKVIRDLATLGCKIDLDDFGTGYASITSLHYFSISRIKIDRSFVSNLPDEAVKQKIVSTMILMARQLQLQVLAEGVETQAELSALRRLGCDYGQGYGLCRPMPLADLIKLPQLQQTLKPKKPQITAKSA